MDIDNASGLAEKFIALSGLAGQPGSAPNIEGNQTSAESADARQQAVTP
jgi:hypothetical protein